MGNLQGVRQLQDPRKLILFLRILIAIPIMHVLVHCLSLPRLMKLLDRAFGEWRSLTNEEIERARLAWKYASFLLVRVLKVKRPCFLRSLIVFHLMRRERVSIRIVLGVRKMASLIEGHSWLLLNGDPLLEQSDPLLTYTEVHAYPDERG
jgi:hypothetical protein